MDPNIILAPLVAGGLRQAVEWVGTIGGFAIAVPFAIEALKRWDRFRWMDQHTTTINRVVAVLAGATSSAGISYAFDDTVGQFVVSGVTYLGMAHFLLDIAAQLGLQELAYRFLIQRRSR